MGTKTICMDCDRTLYGKEAEHGNCWQCNSFNVETSKIELNQGECKMLLWAMKKAILNLADWRDADKFQALLQKIERGAN